MLEFRKGDIVRLHVEVVWDLGQQVSAEIGGTTVYINKDVVEMVMPKLEHGEVVLLGDDEVTFIANYERKCWIEHPINGSNIVSLEDLRRKQCMEDISQ